MQPGYLQLYVFADCLCSGQAESVAAGAHSQVQAATLAGEEAHTETVCETVSQSSTPDAGLFYVGDAQLEHLVQWLPSKWSLTLHPAAQPESQSNSLQQSSPSLLQLLGGVAPLEPLVPAAEALVAGRLGAPGGASAHQELPLKHSWRAGCELWRLTCPCLLGAGANPGPALCPHSAHRVCLSAQRLQQVPAKSGISVIVMGAAFLLTICTRGSSRATYQHAHHPAAAP